MKHFTVFIILIAALAGLVAAAESRWMYVTNTSDKELVYMDTQTIEYPEYRGTTRGDYINFWAKYVKPDKTTDMMHYQMHRPGKQVRSLGWARYNASNKLIDSGDTASEWQTIIPDSIGDVFLNFFSDTRKTTPPPVNGV